MRMDHVFVMSGRRCRDRQVVGFCDLPLPPVVCNSDHV